MAVVSRMSEGRNEQQEHPTSEVVDQPEREPDQEERIEDIRDILARRTPPLVLGQNFTTEEYVAWMRVSLAECYSEPRPDFDPNSVREPINSRRGLVPVHPSEPPPPYPYDEGAEHSRGLSRGPNLNGETGRRSGNRLVRTERRVPPVNGVPRLAEQQARATSEAREPLPYSRFEPSGQVRRDNDRDSARFGPLVSTEQHPRGNQPPAAQNIADDFSEISHYFQLVRPQPHWETTQPAAVQNVASDDSDISQYFQLVRPERHPEINQPESLRNFADNDSDFSNYFRLLSSGQHPESDRPGASAIQDIPGDPELPPYTPSEEFEHLDDHLDEDDPWNFYLAAIEAGQNPPEGQPRTVPDLYEVHLEWLRMRARNRAVNRPGP